MCGQSAEITNQFHRCSMYFVVRASATRYANLIQAVQFAHAGRISMYIVPLPLTMARLRLAARPSCVSFQLQTCKRCETLRQFDLCVSCSWPIFVNKATLHSLGRLLISWLLICFALALAQDCKALAAISQTSVLANAILQTGLFFC